MGPAWRRLALRGGGVTAAWRRLGWGVGARAGLRGGGVGAALGRRGGGVESAWRLRCGWKSVEWSFGAFSQGKKIIIVRYLSLDFFQEVPYFPLKIPAFSDGKSGKD